MTAPWFRVDAAYLTDGRLVRAGWQAGLLWVPVLALLKQREGVLRDDDLDPAVLSRLTGAPFDVVEAGVAGLRSAGMLVRGQRIVAGGAGGRRAIEGWTVESWDRYQPDGRAPWPERKAAFATASQGDGAASQGGAVASRETGGVSRETRMTGQDWTGLDSTKTGRDDLEREQRAPASAPTRPIRPTPKPTARTNGLGAITGPVEDWERAERIQQIVGALDRPDGRGIVRRLGKLAEEKLGWALMHDSDAVDRAVAACAAVGKDTGILLRCFDDEGRIIEEALPHPPGAPKRAAAPEADWSVRKRQHSEAQREVQRLYDVSKERPLTDDEHAAMASAHDRASELRGTY